MDYEMFINYPLEPNEIGFVKVIQTDKPFVFTPEEQAKTEPSTLEIQGFTAVNEALFRFQNKQQELS